MTPHAMALYEEKQRLNNLPLATKVKLYELGWLTILPTPPVCTAQWISKDWAAIAEFVPRGQPANWAKHIQWSTEAVSIGSVVVTGTTIDGRSESILVPRADQISCRYWHDNARVRIIGRLAD